MAKNSFLNHFITIGIGTIVNMLLGLLTTPIITRIVDPTEYGQFSIFTMYASVALTILCLGLDQSLVRYYYEDDSITYKKLLLLKCLYPAIIGTVLASIFIVIISVLGLFEFDWIIALLLCIYTVIQVIYRFSQLIVRLQYKSKVFSFLNILHKASFVLFAIPTLLLIKNYYFMILVVATILSMLTCLIVSVIVERQHWNFKGIKNTNFDFSQKEIMKYAAPYIISMSVVSIFQAADKLALDFYSDYAEVGIYSSTLTLVAIFAIVQSTFNTLWAPMAVERYTKAPEDKEFHQRGNRMITVIMFAIGLTLILIKDIFAILLGTKYREAAYILPFLIFHPIMYTVSETTVGGLVFLKKSKDQVWVAIVSCVANIIGNAFLVPILGGKGAAISTGLSYIIFFTMRTVLANKYYPVDFGLKKFYLLTFVSCLYAAYNTFIAFNIWSVVGYVVCVAIMLTLYWNTTKEIVVYGKDFIKGLINKKTEV